MASKNALMHFIGKCRPKEVGRFPRSHVEGRVGPQHNPIRAKNLNKIAQFRRSMNQRVDIRMAQQGERRGGKMRQFGSYLRGVFPASNHERSRATTVGGKEAN